MTGTVYLAVIPIHWIFVMIFGKKEKKKRQNRLSATTLFFKNKIVYTHKFVHNCDTWVFHSTEACKQIRMEFCHVYIS